MNIEIEGHATPKFYGATTVGERGQVVIPAEARRDFDIKAGDKLVVMGIDKKQSIIITKTESLTEFLSKTVSTLARFEEMVKSDVAQVDDKTEG